MKLLDIEFFLSHDDETLARWANTLNGWEWPEDLPGKPEGFDQLPGWVHIHDPRRRHTVTMYFIIAPVVHLIEIIISKKELLRWHHLNNLGHTNEEFEKWWMTEREEYANLQPPHRLHP